MNHILIAEDEHLIARLVEMTLTRAGYRCTVAEDGRTAADLIEKTDFDMAILDIMLPGLDGYELLASLKPQGVPVIFLTAKSAVKDRVLGLRLGADDYLTKPFLMQELLLRVQHILQRAYRAELSAAKPTVLQLGPRSVDLNDAVVSLPDGKTLALTATELALLRKLAENRGHIVTYDAICDAVWGADYYGYENSLGVHIRHLREKLETEPGAPRFLRTVRGIGYKLTKEGEP